MERNEPYAPWNQDAGACDVCRQDPADCVCPACSECGSMDVSAQGYSDDGDGVRIPPQDVTVYTCRSCGHTWAD